MIDIPAKPTTPAPSDASAVVAPGATVEKLEGGFYAISGATVDSAGTVYFVDHHQHRIFSWSRADGLTVVRHDPLDPVNLAVDKSGNLLVQSSDGPEGTVYSFRPGAPTDQITVLQQQDSTPHQNAAAVLPVNVWDNGEFANQLDLDTYEYTTLAQMFARDVTSPKPKEFVALDGSLFLPAGRVFRQGPVDSYPGMDVSGWRWSNNLDTYGFITARAARRTGRTAQRFEPTARSPILSRLRSVAAKASPRIPRATSTSRTDRLSCTTGRAGQSDRSMYPSVRSRSCSADRTAARSSSSRTIRSTR